MCRARVVYPGEGYGAAMAWIQLVRYHPGDGEDETVLIDKAPQLSGTDVPSTPQRGVLWLADTFLVASPDALMSRLVEPVCGFRWGYTTRNESPETLPVARTDDAAWNSARAVLRERYSSWEFGAERPDER